MIKLVVTDVDGTLVQEGSGVINPEYYEVIKKLSEKGIQVVVASGRAYSSIQALFKPVEHLLWFVADGGAYIKVKEEVTTLGHFPHDMVVELWNDLQKIPDIDAIYCGRDVIYSPFDNTKMYNLLTNEYKMTTKALGGWDKLPGEPTSKISLYRHKDIEKYANEEFIPKWKDKIHITISGEWWIDCLMLGINKATALQYILDKFNYTKEQVFATGDNMNDIEMIELAGTGVAVSTARDEVKRAYQ